MGKASKNTTSKKSASHARASKTSGRGTNRWSQDVKTVSTFPPEGTFNRDAKTIARVMSQKKVSPKGLGLAIRMMQFFINRAGKDLPESRTQELEKAKRILQEKRNRGSAAKRRPAK